MGIYERNPSTGILTPITPSANNFVKKAGDTMGGQLKTSFYDSVVFGSRLGAATTIAGIIDELRFSSGCIGSFSLNTAYTSGNVSIPTGWYNYSWIPHRSGGNNGAPQGDNCTYGTLFLNTMTSSSSLTFVINYANGITGVHKLVDLEEKSYVGMIIHSTKLSTLAKVKAQYGGTTWIQHSGYFLRGSTFSVTANSASSNGGADTVTLDTTQIPSHVHPIVKQVDNNSGNAINVGSGSSTLFYQTNDKTVTLSTGGGQSHSNIPKYKNVYIWERTA